MSNTIRVGIVGAGANTVRHHIPGLQAIENVEIVRICNRTIESSARVSADFSIPENTNNWREITDADDIDAVVIGTWPYMHHPITLASLSQRKHVLCEARMAMNSVEARQMLGAYRGAPGCVAMIVPSPFTLTVDKTIHRLIASGYLGDIVSIDVRGLASAFPSPDQTPHWRERRELSGNNIMSLGIWYEALLRWVGEAKRVYAAGKTVVPSRAEDNRPVHLNIPDHLDVVADMYCGAQLHMQLSSVARSVESPTAILYGTDGVLRFSDNVLSGMKRGEDSFTEIPIQESDRASWRVEEEFVNAIRGVEQVRLTSFEDGVRYMEFTDAVSMSIRNGKEIALPLQTT